MQQVMPLQKLGDLIAPYAPERRTGRQPFPVEVLLHIHFMQQWFDLSDPAMKEALHDMPLFRQFVGLLKKQPSQACSRRLKSGGFKD